MTASPIDELDDRAIVLAAQYLAEDLRRDEPALVRSDAEARLVISALLGHAEISNTDPSRLLPTERDAFAAARRALDAATADADTRETAAELLADPPRDEQMSVDAALASTVVLALLISWLQTKVTLRIRRKDGKTDVDFVISKQAADVRTLRAIATTFRGILGIQPADTPVPDDQDKPGQ